MADAHHGRFVQAVQLLLIRFFLSVKTFATTQQFFQTSIWLRNVSAHVWKHSPQPRLQFLQMVSHPFGLSGVSIAFNQHGGFLCNSPIRLPQFEPAIFRGVRQLLQSLEIQLRIRRMGDVLFLHRCVDVDLCQFRLRNLLIANRVRHLSSRSTSSFLALTHCRHFVMEVECSGTSCCIVSQPQKDCQYGFSTQRSSRDSSDSLNVCCR